MSPGRIEQPERGSPCFEVGAADKTEYLDLDDDGVPDAVERRETRKYPNVDGADVVEEIRELDSGIGPDGIATTVTVTDAVTIDTDHDGVPNAAEVTTVIMHPAARAADQPDVIGHDKGRTR